MMTPARTDARTALGPTDRRLLYKAHVLRDRRLAPDRRLEIAYPRGGRRTEDLASVDAYRHAIAASDPFGWQRRVVGGGLSLLAPAALLGVGAAGYLLLRTVLG